MVVRVRRLVFAAPVGALLMACSFIIPFADYDSRPKPFDSGSDAVPCSDTSGDPKNCGACGHDCIESMTCIDGRCTPTRVYEPAVDGFTVLCVRVDDTSIWVGGYGARGGVRRVDKSNLSHETSVFQLPNMQVTALELDTQDLSWAEGYLVDGGTNLIDSGIGWTSRTAPAHDVTPTTGSAFLMHRDVDRLYFLTTAGQTLWALDRGSDAPTLFASPVDGWPAADDRDVYYFESNTRRLVARAKIGGAVRVVAEGVREGRGMALDGDQVIFVDYGQPSGGVFSVAKAGGQAAPIATGLLRPIFLHVASDYIYVGLGVSANPTPQNPSGSLDGQTVRIDRATGSVLVLSAKHGMDDMAVDDEWVYWVSESKVFRVAR